MTKLRPDGTSGLRAPHVDMQEAGATPEIHKFIASSWSIGSPCAVSGGKEKTGNGISRPCTRFDSAALSASLIACVGRVWPPLQSGTPASVGLHASGFAKSSL